MGDRKRLSTGITMIIAFTLLLLSIKSGSELKKLELLFLSLLRVKKRIPDSISDTRMPDKKVYFFNLQL
jgi:hypothetical protein